MEQSKKYLSDILRAIELTEQFSASTETFQDYLTDLKTQSAIERQLSIIGEAVIKFDNLQPESTLENARKIDRINMLFSSKINSMMSKKNKSSDFARHIAAPR